MSVTWIMQQNLSSEKLVFLRALDSLGSKWKPIEIIPFSEELPDVEVEGPAIVYVSTTLIKNAPKKNWNPGVFFTPEKFKSSVWLQKYGKNMLNSDGRVCTLQELFDNSPEEMFLRPNNDLKDFSGSLTDREGLRKFYESVSSGGFLFGTDLEVFVAETKAIHKEWRCFIVDGRVVASSQYRFRSMLVKSGNVPNEVIDYANEMAAIWSPEKAFVMDICETMDRELRVLELNCFNASGVYQCEVVDIVKAVEALF